jgi:hypothetical protein
VEVHRLPGLRHPHADVAPAPIALGVLHREELRRVQGLVYVADEMKKSRERDCLWLSITFLPQHTLVLS